jgi:hypothetical protein
VPLPCGSPPARAAHGCAVCGGHPDGGPAPASAQAGRRGFGRKLPEKCRKLPSLFLCLFQSTGVGLPKRVQAVLKKGVELVKRAGVAGDGVVLPAAGRVAGAAEPRGDSWGGGPPLGAAYGRRIRAPRRSRNHAPGTARMAAASRREGRQQRRGLPKGVRKIKVVRTASKSS